MIVRCALALAVLACMACPSPAQDDGKAFRLQIGQQGFELDAGDTIEITLPDGTKSKATLLRNEFATFATDRFSFMHPGEISVSRSDLGDGVVQYLMATAIGSMIIIQTYDGIDPSNLASMMLKELTEDDVAAGAKLEQATTTKLVDGKTLNGLTATETLRDDVSNYEVYTHSDGDSGMIVITGLDNENVAEDGPKIDKFWKTLTLK